MTSVRALIAVLLMVGSYVLVAALLVGDVAAMTVVIPPQFDHGLHIDVPSAVMLGMQRYLVTLIRSVFLISMPLAEPARGYDVPSDRAPELWALVHRVADEVGTRRPDRLRIIDEVNAYVVEQSYLLGLKGGTRVLYLGAPLLLGLPPEQVRAVLCHEFGHYTHGHTRLGPLVYRGADVLDRARLRWAQDLRDSTTDAALSQLGMCFLWWYGRAYTRVTAAVRRRQELEADQTAAGVAGASATADALRGIAALMVVWREFLADQPEPIATSDGAVRMFHRALLDTSYRQRLADLRGNPPLVAASRFDAHPSLTQRLALLDRSPAREPDPRSTGPAAESGLADFLVTTRSDAPHPESSASQGDAWPGRVGLLALVVLVVAGTALGWLVDDYRWHILIAPIAIILAGLLGMVVLLTGRPLYAGSIRS